MTKVTYKFNCVLLMTVDVFSIEGACRRDKLQQLTLKEIITMDSIINVKIPISKQLNLMCNRRKNLNFVKMYHKYLSLRPQPTSHNRLFIGYFKGKCST